MHWVAKDTYFFLLQLGSQLLAKDMYFFLVLQQPHSKPPLFTFFLFLI